MSALFCTNHRNRGRASLRMLGIAMTVFLVLTVLTPVFQQAGAEEAPPITDSEQVEDVTQEETPIAEDEGEGEGTGDEGTGEQQLVLDEPAPEAPVAFHFYKYECDSDYGHDYYQLKENCYEPTVDFQFEVYGPNYTEYFTNSFSADNLVAGVYQFNESIPDGYADPLLYCETTDIVGYASGLNEVVTYDGAYEAQLDPGTTLYCEWFNIHEDYRGVVTVIKYECFDVLHPDATFEDYQYECAQPQADVDFKLDGLSTGNPGNYLTDQSGTVSWGDREADTYYLTETVPDGYGTPVVFCDRYFPFDEQVPEYVRYDLYEYAQIQFDLAEGEHITCYWYNVPEHHGGVVTVIKYECLEALGPDASFEDYQYACTKPQADIDFKLDGLSTGNPGNYLTDANGQVSWDEREADTYYLTETVPSGYGKPVVFCDFYFPFDEEVPEYTGYTVEEFAQITFDLKEGQYITCYWFNIPEYEYSTVTVYKYICDEEIALDKDLAFYQDECAEPHQYVPFNLTGESTGDQGTYETDADGKVFWDELETDLYTLDEEIPSGYGDPIVFCGFSAYHDGAVYDGFPVRYEDVIDGAVELDIEIPNSEFFCWYFNIPEYDTSITIYKWLCPENFDLYSSAKDECTEPLNGVEFTIDGPDGYSSQSLTGDSIPYAVYFGGLEEGYYEIEETLPRHRVRLRGRVLRQLEPLAGRLPALPHRLE